MSQGRHSLIQKPPVRVVIVQAELPETLADRRHSPPVFSSPTGIEGISMSATDGATPSGRRPGVTCLEWPADPRALAEIRRAVDSWLSGLDIAANMREDLVYATSEAASNSVEHAYAAGSPGGSVMVTMWWASDSVNIEIVDHGHWLPAVAGPSNRGHGLRLIRGLVDSVTVDSRSGGTTVSLRHPAPRVDALRAEPACGG
jgi:anti-sigma regulatory factor (Ser/Thr protein kinase)